MLNKYHLRMSLEQLCHLDILKDNYCHSNSILPCIKCKWSSYHRMSKLRDRLNISMQSHLHMYHLSMNYWKHNYHQKDIKFSLLVNNCCNWLGNQSIVHKDSYILRKYLLKKCFGPLYHLCKLLSKSCLDYDRNQLRKMSRQLRKYSFHMEKHSYYMLGLGYFDKFFKGIVMNYSNYYYKRKFEFHLNLRSLYSLTRS